MLWPSILATFLEERAMRVSRELVEGSRRRMNFDPGSLGATLKERERSGPQQAEQKAERLRALAEAVKSPETARRALERIVGGNDLVSVNYLSRGLHAARAVGRVQLRSHSGSVLGYGTGFLVGPAVLMTNEHVLSSAAQAADAVVEFDYELDANYREKQPVVFELEPNRLFSAMRDLDFAVVAVAERSLDGSRALAEFGWLPLSGEPGKSEIGEYLSIIQHPGGERKQVCVRENKLLEYQDKTLWYLTDTVGGSSGSPVFNTFWQVVALHHSGVPKTDADGNWLTVDDKIWDSSMDESRVAWLANEGIRISAIVEELNRSLGSHSLIRTVLNPPAQADRNGAGTESAFVGNRRPVDEGEQFWAEDDGQDVSLVVALRFPLPLRGRRAAVALAPPRGTPAALPAPVPRLAPPATADVPAVIEKVEIDQKNYHKRPGYKATFLGTGARLVPLPKILSPASQILTTSKKPLMLNYWNYSAVMNKKRKLAFFVAVNIDGGLRRDVGKREGDKWVEDPRAEGFQITDDFYKHQAEKEAREKNPFDRGHLVRRLDATWGKTVPLAKRDGDDTFHFTNCAPQVFKFNQGTKLWLGIEEFVLDSLEEGKQKACVLNGPVFDGPEADEDGIPDPKGKRVADPTFKGVAIPKYFWKLVVVLRDGKLSAAAFLLSQQDLVLDIPRIEERLTADEARAFQISLSDLASLARLDLGKLVKRDTHEAAHLERGHVLRELADIRLS